jgi:hypothetical protein
MRKMKISFILSTFILLGTLIIWGSGGFHTGWSQDQIPTPYVDEITGIETVIFEDGFRAGLDFAIPGFLASLALAGAGLFLRFRRHKKNP